MEFALQRFMHLPQLGWLPVGLAVVAVVAEAVRDRQLGLASTYWIVAIAVALFTVRGSGADVNYLIESAALACILASTSIDRLWRLDGARGWRASGAVLLAGATLAWGSSVWQEWQTWKGAPEQIGHWSYRAPLDRSLPLHEVAQADSVLAEEPTMVLLAGKRVVVSDPYHLSMLESAGRFDPTELAELIRRGTFDLIVLQGDARRRRGWAVPFWPEKVRQAIRDHYVLTSRNDIFWLYAPAAQPARRIGPQPDSRPFDTTPVHLTATPVTPSSPNSP
jgi:hypothetical protein